MSETETADVFISLEFAAYLATTEVGQGRDLDTDDEHELHRAFRAATFKYVEDAPIGEPGAGLVLPFQKNDDGHEGLYLLTYMAENDHEMCDDSEHGDSYRQSCLDMAPGLEAARKMLLDYLESQDEKSNA
jgi:hypothetical protein